MIGQNLIDGTNIIKEEELFMKNKLTIFTTISISSTLMSGAILSFSLISKPFKFSDLGIFVGLILGAIGIISFGISLYFDYEQNNDKK